MFLMGLQDHVAVEDVGSLLQKSINQALVSSIYQRLDDLGLHLSQDAYVFHMPAKDVGDHAVGDKKSVVTSP